MTAEGFPMVQASSLSRTLCFFLLVSSYRGSEKAIPLFLSAGSGDVHFRACRERIQNNPAPSPYRLYLSLFLPLLPKETSPSSAWARSLCAWMWPSTVLTQELQEDPFASRGLHQERSCGHSQTFSRCPGALLQSYPMLLSIRQHAEAPGSSALEI